MLETFNEDIDFDRDEFITPLASFAGKAIFEETKYSSKDYK